MKQKGFATIFGLCMILVIALIVRSIQDAETNHAREVVNFETEQVLQSAAESAIVEASEFVRDNPDFLPYSQARKSDKIPIPVTNPNDDITVEVWGERGKIYRYTTDNKNNNVFIKFELYDDDGKEIVDKTYCDGVYFMGTATIDGGFFGEKIYRRAFAYIIDDADLVAEYKDTTIYFMELPAGSTNEIRKNK